MGQQHHEFGAHRVGQLAVVLAGANPLDAAAEPLTLCRVAAAAHLASTLLRELPKTTADQVVLCTDLHAENVLAAQREQWLVIDPKPYIGDRTYDPVQHLLNCHRLLTDPGGLVRRMAHLLDLDTTRLRLWAFARCAQESLDQPALAAVAAQLEP